MRYSNYLKPLGSLERISRQYLCDNFDQVLDRIDKENTGFVILNDEGKDGQVICPYRWMNFYFDEEFGFIVICAIRYAIGRHTVAPELIAEFVGRYINVLAPKTICTAINDIEQAIDHNEIDSPGVWLGLLDAFKKRLPTLNSVAEPEEQS